MHPRMCMHILGCIAAVTATVIFCRGLCLPINAPMYFNVTCHTTDAMPRTMPPSVAVA